MVRDSWYLVGLIVLRFGWFRRAVMICSNRESSCLFAYSKPMVIFCFCGLGDTRYCVILSVYGFRVSLKASLMVCVRVS